MEIKIGDVLVFAGHREGRALDSHFKNFKIGKRYEVSGFTDVYYEIDDVTRMGGSCVLFKGESHGCREENLDTYFVRLSEWRESLISKILPKQIFNILKSKK